ncbi:hypothetical protein PYCCODRAFT_1519111 [Trametes coccinea BRFM310]|uniref:F-box domain-containing protein n=1 Tax=Trametes coccinea (strain BRFM310) TaxID=1353009 RepID=A0A1Y2ICY5_TRAC3|nr:hypothetical protein PYCCODRAFT_1519111 [Trametes coccinea BRFM310]
MLSHANAPQEVLDHIIDYLAADETSTKSDLARTALVGRAWRLPSQRHLHKSQAFSPPLGTLWSRLRWFQRSHGSGVVPLVREVQFWRLGDDDAQFLVHWTTVLQTFPNVQTVSIHFHQAGEQFKVTDQDRPLPTFPSVTILRLSNVAFITCRDFAVLAGMLPNLNFLYLDQERWTCADLIEQALHEKEALNAMLKRKARICDVTLCRPLALRSITMDCSEGLEILQCAVRHVNLDALYTLDIKLPANLRCSEAGMTSLIMGITLPAMTREHMGNLLSGAKALETLIYRMPPSVACKRTAILSETPIPAPSSPRLRHLAIHYVRLNRFVPTEERPKMYCLPGQLAKVVSRCLETVNVTFALSTMAQLKHVPWELVDRILSDRVRFPVLRECALNVSLSSNGTIDKRCVEPATAFTISEVRFALTKYLPELSELGMLAVYEAEDFS